MGNVLVLCEAAGGELRQGAVAQAAPHDVERHTE